MYGLRRFIRVGSEASRELIRRKGRWPFFVGAGASISNQRSSRLVEAAHDGERGADVPTCACKRNAFCSEEKIMKRAVNPEASSTIDSTGV